MSGSWFGKKDDESEGSAAPPPVPTTEERANPSIASGELGDLTGQLGRLGELFSESNRQIANYLLRRETQTAADSQEFTGALGAELESLSKKLDRLTESNTPASHASVEMPDPKALESLLGPLNEKLDRQETAFATFSDQLNRDLNTAFCRMAETLTPATAPAVEEQAEETPSAGNAAWERALLGAELADHPNLAFQRQQLLDGILDGNPGAFALAGQLLVFQSTPPERMPQLLKDLGEAYYRWQPKTDPGNNPFEEALIEWLVRTCESQGLGNTIEPVHPGERFDASRHNASGRGVEITQVHGWIVLRDNGRVYMKASVTAR